MKKIFFLVLISQILTYCTSVKPRIGIVDVTIYTDIDSTIVCVKKTNNCYRTPVLIPLEHSNEDLVLELKKDTIIKEVILKSKITLLNTEYPDLSGLELFDVLLHPKKVRYRTYRERNYISMLDPNSTKFQKKFPSQKHQFSLKFSIPEGNFFYINKGNRYGNDFGFLGISTGFEYYFSKKYSINMDIGVMTDFELPFPAPIDYVDFYRDVFNSSAKYLDFQIGRNYRDFHVDLGIQINKTNYFERIYNKEEIQNGIQNPSFITNKANQYNAGLAFSASRGWLGFNYYPSLFTWENGVYNFHYTHILMFELQFKLKLNKYSKHKKALFKNPLPK